MGANTGSVLKTPKFNEISVGFRNGDVKNAISELTDMHQNNISSQSKIDYLHLKKCTSLFIEINNYFGIK